METGLIFLRAPSLSLRKKRMEPSSPLIEVKNLN